MYALTGYGSPVSIALNARCRSPRARTEMLVLPPRAVRPLPDRLGKEVDQFPQSLAPHVPGFVAQGKPAPRTHGTQERIDEVYRSTDVKRIPVPRGHPAGVPDHGGFRSCKVPGEACDFTGADPCFLLRPLGCVGLDELNQVFQVFDPLPRKFRVVQPFRQENVQDGEIERIVGSRPYEDELIGLRRGCRRPDIDHRELAAVVHPFEQIVDFLDIDGFKDVSGLQDHMPRVLVIVHRLFPAETEDGKRRVIHVARTGSVVVGIIRRTQAAYESLVQILERPSPVGKKDALRPVFTPDLPKAVRHIVQGFIPGCLAPLSLAALPLPDEGLPGPLVAVDQCEARRTASADRAIDTRRVRVSLDECADVVFHLHLDGTTNCAHAAKH